MTLSRALDLVRSILRVVVLYSAVRFAILAAIPGADRGIIAIVDLFAVFVAGALEADEIRSWSLIVVTVTAVEAARWASQQYL